MDKLDEAIILKVKGYQTKIEKYIKQNDTSKLLYYINRLDSLQIRIFHLEETLVGKTVYGLVKYEYHDVAQAAKVLVLKWKKIVLEEEWNNSARTSEDSGHNSDTDICSSGLNDDNISNNSNPAKNLTDIKAICKDGNSKNYHKTDLEPEDSIGSQRRIVDYDKCDGKDHDVTRQDSKSSTVKHLKTCTSLKRTREDSNSDDDEDQDSNPKNSSVFDGTQKKENESPTVKRLKKSTASKITREDISLVDTEVNYKHLLNEIQDSKLGIFSSTQKQFSIINPNSKLASDSSHKKEMNYKGCDEVKATKNSSKYSSSSMESKESSFKQGTELGSYLVKNPGKYNFSSRKMPELIVKISPYRESDYKMECGNKLDISKKETCKEQFKLTDSVRPIHEEKKSFNKSKEKDTICSKDSSKPSLHAKVESLSQKANKIGKLINDPSAKNTFDAALEACDYITTKISSSKKKSLTKYSNKVKDDVVVTQKWKGIHVKIDTVPERIPILSPPPRSPLGTNSEEVEGTSTSNKSEVQKPGVTAPTAKPKKAPLMMKSIALFKSRFK